MFSQPSPKVRLTSQMMSPSDSSTLDGEDIHCGRGRSRATCLDNFSKCSAADLAKDGIHGVLSAGRGDVHPLGGTRGCLAEAEAVGDMR